MSSIEEELKHIEDLMEVFLGGKVDEKYLLILSKYLKMNPEGKIDVKALYQSIKRDQRDHKIDDILNKNK